MRNFWLHLLRFFLLLMIVPTALYAQQPGQITLTGTVTNASGSSVQVQLINCAQYSPRVLYNGSLLSVVVPLTYTATPSSNGSWSVNLWPNDLLVCGGTTGASAYQVSYTQNGAPSGTPEDFQLASTGPNPYNTTVQPPLTTLPPATALHSNYNFQSLTLGNSLNAQTGSIGALNVNSLTINGQPIAGQGQGVPNTGGIVSGTLSQNFANYFNPQFALTSPGATIANATNIFWSGTIPGTSAYNYGLYLFSGKNLYINKNTPGCAGFEGNCYNTETAPFAITENLNAQGGTTGSTITLNHWGLGDTIARYTYLNTFGGQQDGGGPEGAELFSGGITEPANTWTGTVATAGQGQTTITANCTEDCGNGTYGFGTDPEKTSTPASLGQGLIVMDEQSPTASGQIASVTNGSGETPGTITVNVTSGVSNLAVSTCYGTLNSALTPTPDPSGSGTQSVTFTLTLASGSGDCVAGEVASFAGFMHDQALITAVGTASGGQQQITASVRQYHEAGSYMFENPNSDAGLYMNMLANVVSGIQFPIDILGVESVSGNTAVMWYRWFFAGDEPGANGFPAGNMLVAASDNVSPTSLSNTSGTVTMSGGNIGTGSPWLNDSTLYISNASNSAFDGACTNSKADLVYPYTVTCTQSSSTGDTATSATVNISNAAGTNPYGNTDANFYQGAAVVNTQDTSAPITLNGQTVYPTDGKQFEVEANEMPLAGGDSLVEGHSSTMLNTIENTRSTILNPFPYGNSGIGISMTGAYGGFSAANDQNSAAISLTNGSPTTNYTYNGGTQYPPTPIVLHGDWTGLVNMYQPPQAFTSLLSDPNCAGTTGEDFCTDPGYWFDLLSFAGNGSGLEMRVEPYTNTLEFLHGTLQFDSPGNDTAFVFHDGGYTYGIGFGGRYPYLSGAQYAPLWTGTGVNNDLPEISQCNNSSQCGLADSGIPVARIVPLPTATLALGTSAIATNSCATAQTVTVTGATTSMVATFSGDGVLESSVSGYGAGGLRIYASVTAANTVSVQVCNPTAASITPGALTLNVTAMQ